MSAPYNGFIWGTATSSYQIEGAAHVDGRRDSIWDTFTRMPGNVVDGSTGDAACDHYHRLEEDLDLLAELGADAYRFSVAWPRIIPEGTGAVNPAGLDFYRRLVAGLTERGIQSFATLYHWDLPQPLEVEGGWRNRATALAFAKYARIAAEELGSAVTAWATLNEPWCSSFLGYGTGIHAPGSQDMSGAVAAAHHLNLAHGLGVLAVREVGADNVGIVLNLTPVRIVGEGDGLDDLATMWDVWRNHIWLDPIADGAYGAEVKQVVNQLGAELPVRPGDLEIISTPLDWLGVNYYNDTIVPAPPPGPRTAMGWPITPEGMYDALAMAAARTGLPLYVTENGAAYEDSPDGSLDDADRIAYLDEHIGQVLRAAGDGIDVRGYFLWSLLDNFEWAEGYTKRFGIVHVNYETQRRTPRASYGWYRDRITHSRIGDQE